MRRYRNNRISVRFIEDIGLTDLMKHSGISAFTKKWKDIRLKLKGGGNRSAKLVKMAYNKKKNFVSFFFLQEPTYTFDTKVVIAPSMKFKDDNLYTQEIRILNFSKYYSGGVISNKDLKDILLKAPIQIWCDCPSFHWQGMNYNISIFDGSIHPTDIPPTHWKNYHNDDNLVCKHLDLLLASIKFWISPMASALNKYLNSQ